MQRTTTFYYTQAQKVDMVLALGAASGNKRNAASIFSSWYPDLVPSPNTVLAAYHNLRTGETPLKKARRATVATAEKTVDALARIAQDPHLGHRSVAAEAGVSSTTVLRIMKRNKLHPFHVQLHQNLVDGDLKKREEFANWFLTKCEDDPNFWRNILWTDEANFSRNGQVNLHNAHYWSEENPHWVLRAKHQYKWSFNVWVGLYDGNVVGPFFYDGSLNGLRYVREILGGLVDEFQVALPLSACARVWFQHDGAPPHSSSAACRWLDGRFPEQWIGRGGPVTWPARSPDLNPLDFFFGGMSRMQCTTRRRQRRLYFNRKFRTSVGQPPQKQY